MIKVGILPSTNINIEDNPYSDTYRFFNIFSKRIFECGAIPIGIILNDGKIEKSSLQMCDAFMICGGNKIEPYFFETINFAIQNNKPLLGICLGMQAIGIYSYIENNLIEEKLSLTKSNFIKKYQTLKNEKFPFFNQIDNHYIEKITRSNANVNKHKVIVNKNSKLFSIYQKSELNIVSMHRYVVNKYGSNVVVNCTCGDTIEGLEYKDKNLFIVGVQWHPELEKENNILFSAFIKAAEERKQ